MAHNAAPAPLPDQGSPAVPSPSARLSIQLGPTQLGGTAEGNVPPDQVHHLITTFGMMGSACAGITGAVFTLRGDPSRPVLALAELVLAFTVAVLIAVTSRLPAPPGAQYAEDQRDQDGGKRAS
jgi:hypothetical protein